MMTKRDFVALAQAITCITNKDERRSVAILIAAVCQTSNPRFDYRKFLTAAGVEE